MEIYKGIWKVSKIIQYNFRLIFKNIKVYQYIFIPYNWRK